MLARARSVTRVLLSIIAGLAVACGALWWQYSLKAEKVGELGKGLEQSQARAESLTSTLRIQRQLTTEVGMIDQNHTEGQADAQEQNETLRTDVDAGTKRLRVSAVCPAGVPATAATASSTDEGTAELAASSRTAYFALRRQLIDTELALAGLQDYVRAVCLATPGNQ